MLEAKKLEIKLYALIGRRAKLVSKFDEEIAAVKAAILEVGCPHTETREFSWEHDDGYGRQSMCKGRQCTLCHKKKYYEGSSLWH